GEEQHQGLRQSRDPAAELHQAAGRQPAAAHCSRRAACRGRFGCGSAARQVAGMITAGVRNPRRLEVSGVRAAFWKELRNQPGTRLSQGKGSLRTKGRPMRKLLTIVAMLALVGTAYADEKKGAPAPKGDAGGGGGKVKVYD